VAGRQGDERRKLTYPRRSESRRRARAELTARRRNGDEAPGPPSSTRWRSSSNGSA
jgi:hypothetical protein